MKTLRLEINLHKIRHNAKTIIELCQDHNIEVVGVTKGAAGKPEVAQAMLEAGVTCLGDSRLGNIRKLRRAGITVPIMLIRIPSISRANPIVKHVDVSLNSERQVIEALSEHALRYSKRHEIIVMIDVGDLREGVMCDNVIDFMKPIIDLRGIHISGIGTNVGCYGGVFPTEENMGLLVETAHALKSRLNLELETISVGGTNCLQLVREGKMPSDITQIRVGEGILLGRDSSRNNYLPDSYHDTFRLVSEIIEIKDKPSTPIGEIGVDAFGNVPTFDEQGIRTRAIVALGRQDVHLDGLKPVDDAIRILGGSSDHTILDITDSQEQYEIGQEVVFEVLYPGLLSAITSPYIEHVILT